MKVKTEVTFHYMSSLKMITSSWFNYCQTYSIRVNVREKVSGQSTVFCHLRTGPTQFSLHTSCHVIQMLTRGQLLIGKSFIKYKVFLQFWLASPACSSLWPSICNEWNLVIHHSVLLLQPLSSPLGSNDRTEVALVSMRHLHGKQILQRSKVDHSCTEYN